MHGFAGALGQPLQMGFGHAHDIHAVDNAAGKFKHFQRQAVAVPRFVLRHIPQRRQAGQQPVHRAFGQPGALRQPLQRSALRVGGQLFNQGKGALHALYAGFFRHKTTSAKN